MVNSSSTCEAPMSEQTAAFLLNKWRKKTKKWLIKLLMTNSLRRGRGDSKDVPPLQRVWVLWYARCRQMTPGHCKT